MNYIIKKIDEEQGQITVSYDIDNLEQTLANAPLDSADSLKAFLENYGNAYEAGLNQNTVVAPKEVKAMVGKTIEIAVIEDTPPVEEVLPIA
jgi:hypothetical protein